MKYTKVPATLEKYERSYRVTPERPTSKSNTAKDYTRVKAEIYHWPESDAMDIFICPPRDPARATTQVVKRWPWGGSVSRSIYGTYRINMPAQDMQGQWITFEQMCAYFEEVEAWITADRANYNPLPKPLKRKSNSKSPNRK